MTADAIAKCSCCTWVWEVPGTQMYCRLCLDSETCEGPKVGV